MRVQRQDVVNGGQRCGCGGGGGGGGSSNGSSSSSGGGGGGNHSVGGGGRYFGHGSALSRPAGRGSGGVNLTLKCARCGEVGHSERRCATPDSALPSLCHLCAGTDHDASECVNVVCFRCACFGHQSRDCTASSSSSSSSGYGYGYGYGSQRPLPLLCCQCGLEGHGAGMRCAWGGQVDSDAEIVCITCGLLGHSHTHCPRSPQSSLDGVVLPDARVFCPECGAEGHHLDPQKCRAVLQAPLPLPQAILLQLQAQEQAARLPAVLVPSESFVKVVWMT